MMEANRKLTAEEERLLRFLLLNGEERGRDYLSQIDRLEVTPWKCECGCASVDFAVDGKSPPPNATFEPLDTFVFGPDDELCGLFVFTRNGVLGGIEVFGFGGDALPTLPQPESLRR